MRGRKYVFKQKRKTIENTNYFSIYLCIYMWYITVFTYISPVKMHRICLILYYSIYFILPANIIILYYCIYSYITSKRPSDLSHIIMHYLLIYCTCTNTQFLTVLYYSFIHILLVKNYLHLLIFTHITIFIYILPLKFIVLTYFIYGFNSFL